MDFLTQFKILSAVLKTIENKNKLLPPEGIEKGKGSTSEPSTTGPRWFKCGQYAGVRSRALLAK